MKALAILAITSPESLFKNGNIKQAFRDLARVWHPDVNKDPHASDVFAHISKLYEEALKKEANGAWGYNGLAQVADKFGVSYRIKYHYGCPFELGTMYVADTTLCYLIEEKFSKLAQNFVNQTKSLHVPTKGESTLRKCLPSIKKVVITDDNRTLLVLNKTRDVLPLSVALNYFGGKIEPKSASWVISTMHNMLCALMYNKLTHNDISTTTYFVSPEHHTGLLLGGWWYAVPQGSALLGVPSRSYGYMPASQKKSKIASEKLDSELIRAIGREILGDVSGTALVANGIPKEIANWLNIPSNNHPFADYEKWGEVLTKAYGPRKFIPMEIDIKKAYDMMPRSV